MTNDFPSIGNAAAVTMAYEIIKKVSTLNNVLIINNVLYISK